MTHKDRNKLQREHLLERKFIAIHIPDCALGLRVSDTVQLQRSREKMIDGVITLVRFHMNTAESESELTTVDHDILENI